ncbi:iron-containing alcohol dehydrogenase [Candidatus Sumerlaeota bacterium]|nr:iron-containing alcohol dehydrogenase [Candidatus Sumerlaeota bacterium]
MRFEYYGCKHIVFEPGSFIDLPELIAERGGRLFLVMGRRSLKESGKFDSLIDGLAKFSIIHQSFEVDGEPTVSMVRKAARKAKAFDADVVAAVGGGSVIDLGKAVSGLVANGGDAEDYLEGVGKGLQFCLPSLPYIAVPTTAGTGSEVTRNAVITGDDRSFKKSIRSQFLIPDVALVDPELTLGASPEVTVACGFDAIAQLIESYTSNHAGPMTDALALSALRPVRRALKQAWQNPQDISARTSLSYAALISGLTLANAGLGAVHGLASPLGAMFPAPHGAVCAILLPHVIRANYIALCERAPKHPTLKKYSALARSWLRSSSAPLVFADSLHAETQEMNIAGLSRYKVARRDIPRIVAQARGSSMKYNPIELTDDELAAIIQAAL